MDSQEARTLPRYLVLGSTGYGGVDSVDWIEGELPNIVDYDLIIIDVPSLTYDKLASADLKRFEIIEKDLIRFLFSSGKLIIITDKIIYHKRPNRYPEVINNYIWCPFLIVIEEEVGKSVVIKQDKFKTYLKQLSEWDYYFFIPYEGVKDRFVERYGPTYRTKYRIISLPIVENRYGRVLAGSYQIQVRLPQTKESAYAPNYTEYPQIPDFVTGDIMLLPRILGLDNRTAVNLILEEITGNPQHTLSPQWADEIVLPGVYSLFSQIDEKQQHMRGLQADIDRLTGEIDNINEYKRLIYSTGSELENIVERCFNELGGRVIPAKYSQEEFILIYADNEYLIEVKGVSKSIALSHLRQLNDYLLKYQEDTGQVCKGILFGNAWYNLPPQNRDKAETQVFPDNVNKRAENWDIALISSIDFFQAFVGFLEHGQGAPILDAVTTQKGIVKFD